MKQVHWEGIKSYKNFWTKIQNLTEVKFYPNLNWQEANLEFSFICFLNFFRCHPGCCVEKYFFFFLARVNSGEGKTNLETLTVIHMTDVGLDSCGCHRARER